MADFLARDVAEHPLGRRLRRRALDRAFARRVRRGERRFWPPRRSDRNADAFRRGPLSSFRPGRRIHGRGRPRAARLRDARRDELARCQGEEQMAIAARNVRKSFGDYVALDDVSLDIPSGSLTALLGPSGSGKSTLLRIIAGLESPDEGRVEIFGKNAALLTPQQRGVGFVFQHYAAFKHMTVWENVAFGLTIRKHAPRAIANRVDELLELVQLQGFAARFPSQLSGGQRQRMALARALAVEPQVLLLDEPFGALDASVRKDLRQWLRRLHDEVHVTTIFVTHDQEEAMEVAGQLVVMNQGRVEQSGSADEL